MLFQKVHADLLVEVDQVVSDLQNVLVIAGLDPVDVHNILYLELQILYLIGYATDLPLSSFGAFQDTVHFFINAHDNPFEIDTFFDQEA